MARITRMTQHEINKYKNDWLAQRDPPGQVVTSMLQNQIQSVENVKHNKF